MDNKDKAKQKKNAKIEESEYIIQLKGLTKQYGNKCVVNDINLNIKKGEFVTFLGPSGCGKTTTLRMIAGFEIPTQGKVLFGGEDIAKLPPHKSMRCSHTSTYSTTLHSVSNSKG